MNHHAQLQTFGGWGVPSPPAFAFDLLKGAIGQGQKNGLQRYGRAPGAGNEDKRPVAPAYRTFFDPAWADAVAAVALVGGDTATQSLLKVPAPFNGPAGLSFTDARPENPHAFGLPVSLLANESLSFRAYVYPRGKTESGGDKGHVWHLRIGSAGAGVLFQVRDGNAEVARMSPTWTRGGEDQLRLLWGLAEPTPDETDQIETLKKSLYSTFESLSFERSVGRDNWVGFPFGITLIPEPRGALHVVLEGADATMIEFADLLEQDDPPPLWGAGAGVECGGTGGAWMLQTSAVRFQNATLEFGPYQNGYWTDAWDDCQFSSSFGVQKDGEGNPLAGVTFERIEYSEVAFGFRATFTSTDARYGAWLYGLSARLPNGARSGTSEGVHLDTDAPTPTNANAQTDASPITDVSLRCDESGQRSAEVLMRDVKGRTSAPGGVDDMVNRVASLSIDGQPWMRAAIIARGSWSDLRKFAQETPGGAQQSAVYVAGRDSHLSLNLDEGWIVLKEALCDPPPIGDGLRLGEAFRRLLRVPGFTDAEMARVPADLGPQLSRARGGENWANVPDAGSSVENALSGLLDRYGLGLRFFRDENGVWALEPAPTTVVAQFVSTPSLLLNDPDGLRGGTRGVILSPLDWQRDWENYHNAFRVIGGKDGAEIVREYLDSLSLQLPAGGTADARWFGRVKRYPTLRDSGLKTEGQVNYALRSLRFRWGKSGRLATFVTWLNRDLRALDRVTCDGIPCEVVSWQGTAAADTMQLRVREIHNV